MVTVKRAAGIEPVTTVVGEDTVHTSVGRVQQMPRDHRPVTSAHALGTLRISAIPELQNNGKSALSGQYWQETQYLVNQTIQPVAILST